MSRHTPQPLDTEERELALRLSRLGAPGEPSPSLDARILASAHAAAAKRPAARLQRRPRWPVAFGIAASLVLAVGVAWQLRPLPQAPAYEEAASAAMVARETVGGPSADAVGVPAPAPMSPAVAAEPVQRRESSAQDVQAKAVAGDEEDASGAAAAAQSSIVFDAPVAPQPAPPPPPPAATSAEPEFVPAPPAPTSSAPPSGQRARDEQAARSSNMQARPISSSIPAPTTAARPRGDAANDAVLSDAAAAAEASDEGFDERPPNTADAPEVRLAWLQRIRELIASGDTASARDSLQEFKRRYPGVVLPDDLRRFDQSP